MKIKMNTIIAIAITICFTASICMVIPLQASNSPYNPFLDYNHDGKISLQDLVTLANSYGTSGDPTENVNVTNWPSPSYTLITGTLTASSSNSYVSTPTFYCGGYSRLSVMILVTSANITSGGYITMSLINLQWYSSMNPTTGYSNEQVDQNLFNFTTFSNAFFYLQSTFITETKGPYCSLSFLNTTGFNAPAPWYITFNYAVYLRNE